MLMAAGLGTRLRPFTQHRAKPLLPLMGIPILQFAIDQAQEAAVTDFVVNIHHLPEYTRTLLGTLDYGAKSQLTLSDESALLLGSAGGLKKAQRSLGTPFLYINGDVLCSVDIKKFVQKYQALNKPDTLFLGLFPKAQGAGKYREILLGPQMQVTGLGTSDQPKSDRPFFMGLAIIPEVALEAVPLDRPTDFAPLILEPAISKQSVHATFVEGIWLDIGSAELWYNAHLELLRLLDDANALPQVWRSRIEGSNHKVKNGVWISRQLLQTMGSEKESLLKLLLNFQAPLYLGMPQSAPATFSEIETCLKQTRPMVLYPQAGFNCAKILGSGIGFNGDWISV